MTNDDHGGFPHRTDYTDQSTIEMHHAENLRRQTSGAGLAAAAGALSQVHYGVDRSPRAQPYAVQPLRLAVHEYRRTSDGRMEHYIDGVLRATVGPEGLAAYAEIWPDCAELARELKAADR